MRKSDTLRQDDQACRPENLLEPAKLRWNELQHCSFSSGIDDIGLRWADRIRRATDLFNQLATSRVTCSLMTSELNVCTVEIGRPWAAWEGAAVGRAKRMVSHWDMRPASRMYLSSFARWTFGRGRSSSFAGSFGHLRNDVLTPGPN